MAIKAKKQSSNGESEWSFGPRNYILFGIALVIIILGYVSLSQGSITLAPILLILGYCVLIPIAIMLKTPAADPAEEGVDTQQTAA
jgi:hypothetical protein